MKSSVACLLVGLLVSSCLRPAPDANGSTDRGVASTATVQGLLIPDTVEVLARLAALHPTVKLSVFDITTHSLQWPERVPGRPVDALVPGQATILNLQGPDSAIVLVFVSRAGGAPRLAYSTEMLTPMDGCGALSLGIMSVGVIPIRGRQMVEVRENHSYYNDCIDWEYADTTFTHYLDVDHGFRDVLKLESDIVRRTVRSDPCAGECWHTDTVEFRTTIGAEDNGWGFAVDILGAGPGQKTQSLFFDWSADSTRLVPKRQ